MTKFTVLGKIQKIKNFEKVTFVTVHCRDGKASEFIDVTVFDKDFFNKWFSVGQWICITGHLHKNSNMDYKTELIADSYFFVGENPNKKISDPQATPCADE